MKSLAFTAAALSAHTLDYFETPCSSNLPPTSSDPLEILDDLGEDVSTNRFKDLTVDAQIKGNPAAETVTWTLGDTTLVDDGWVTQCLVFVC